MARKYIDLKNPTTVIVGPVDKNGKLIEGESRINEVGEKVGVLEDGTVYTGLSFWSDEARSSGHHPLLTKSGQKLGEKASTSHPSWVGRLEIVTMTYPHTSWQTSRHQRGRLQSRARSGSKASGRSGISRRSRATSGRRRPSTNTSSGTGSWRSTTSTPAP